MEILNKTEIMKSTGFIPNVSLIMSGIILVIVILLFIFNEISCSDFGFFIFIVFMILLISMAVECRIESYSVSTGRYKYEVILNDDYSAVELYENYEVISKRGRIWEIKDKEINDQN